MPKPFNTKPPFEKNSDQELMKPWEFIGPEGKEEREKTQTRKKKSGVWNLLGRKWGMPIPLKP
ncbi:hypothetical protein KJ603_02060 [Patescibacteria group bacterium]|nr:hypothetical protein [Patescibacteria group bacterium]